MFNILFAISLFLLNAVHAADLQGVFKQGGFVYGKTDPSAKVFLNDTETKVAKDGTFFVGIDRNEKENSVLRISLFGGIEEKHPLNIEQRTYQTQKLTGIKKNHVNPYEKDMVQIKDDKQQILKARGVFEPLEYVFGTFEKPVENYRISGVYGSRRTYNGEERNWHKGTDFAAPTGTPIYAPAPGKVRLALENSFFNGNLVILDHGHQLMTIYAHMDSMDVKAGDNVSTGDMLGKVGSTGRSTGPHLHWGAYWRNMALDPLLLLKK